MVDVSHKNEFSVENKAPLMGYHVHENIITMPKQRLLSVIRLKGISHETRTTEELNRFFKLENRYLQALGKKEGKNLMLQSYTTKSKVITDAEYKLELPILQEFVDLYTSPFKKGKYKQVGYSLALILKYQDFDNGLARMSELLTISKTMLEPFDISILGMEENENGTLLSQVGRFYSQVLNGNEQDVICSDTRLGDAVIDSVTNFGHYDFVQNRPNRGGERFATTYDLRDFPTPSIPAMWDEAIEEQFDFTLVQNFIFEDRNKVKSQFKKHTSDLVSVEGESDQTKEIEDAIQQITQGTLAFGRYSASLIVYGDTPDQAIDNGAKMESLFITQDTGFVRSTVTNIDSWFSQFPGVTDAIYPMSKSTENFACGFSLHSSPVGKAKGNPLGDGTALIPLKTINDGVFLLNAHDSPVGQNNLGEKLPGHIAVTAQTGTGKSTLEAVLLLFFSRWNPMFFCIDYNYSMENLLRALGTKYFSVSPGEFTGIQIFQFPDSPGLRQFQFDIIKFCVGGADNDEERQIQEGISSVMAHSHIENRSLSLMLQGIAKKGGNCLHSRLAKWCRQDSSGFQGQNAWVLDSPKNLFNPKDFRRLAFDCTKILNKEYTTKHADIMEVLFNSFFYLKKEMHASQPGQLLINMIAEYWVPLSYESTAELIKEVLKAGRTRGELLVMDTQSPEDALNTEYAPAVIQQVITQIWMANNKAEKESYAKFNIKDKEFEKVVEINPTSREFMVKQGHQSVMVKFVLDDALKYWLPLLSTTIENRTIASSIREKLNTDEPNIWVPAFLAEMANR
ncbi:VirB4 family type IV secretion system protein [Yersinia ruckeri]|uniref:VirB4 family type IV secretion system protein n=1 Tax=Yersinia ruckeri TaxID=29486 RepID=UPI002237F228|nr:conjugal transfer protein [Yersinia ruckeri]MCW6572924.1 conjugal transfer protein [Yersinia ruckeri]HDL7537465.1 conjugal transfer protein [Yersinia enterocolitica]